MEEMPLVKRIQDKFGPDKLQVLLLSVDAGYNSSKEIDSKTLASQNSQRMHKQHVDWPNILLPNGFDDTQKRFNLDGYGLTLIGPDGIVRGAHIRAESVETLLSGSPLTTANND